MSYIQQIGVSNLTLPYQCSFSHPFQGLQCNYYYKPNQNQWYWAVNNTYASTTQILITNTRKGISHELNFGFQYPGDCQCSHGEVGYCLPYGNSQWALLHNVWRENVLGYIEDSCHQHWRFKPAAWLKCGKDIPFDLVSYWTYMLFNLTNYHFVQDEMMRKYVTDLNMFSPKNFPKMLSQHLSLFLLALSLALYL